MPPRASAGDQLTDVWVVLVCGLPGSGKSTLRKRLVKNGWAYASQDEMGTRDAFEKAIIKALKERKSCVIDRCNVTPSERRMCMQVANQSVDKCVVKGVTLHYEAVWMATPPDLCKARALGRELHETLNAENAPDVIDKFCKNLSPPQRTGQEPYEAVHMVADDNDMELVVQRYAKPANIDISIRPAQCAAVAAFVQGDVAQGDASLPAELFVVRHGERADRAKNRDEGHPDDAPLTKEGQETAKRAGAAMRSLARSPIVIVYSSPFFRCLQTANGIAAELGCAVRIEPGLSEIGTVFEEKAPRLRNPEESLARALQRVTVDLSQPPVHPKLPNWPEAAQDANTRVLDTATSLAQRHEGQAICLVCHAHSVIEITRHISKQGGGAAGSRCGYCAMSHISPTGILQQCLDLSYLKDASSVSAADLPKAPVVLSPKGRWAEGWCWSDEVERDPVDVLLEMSLEEALLKYPKFQSLFGTGTEDQKEKWRQAWALPDDNMRWKLWQAQEKGYFEET